MHTASWLASTSFVFSPSLASFSLPFSAECRGGRGERHRCYWLQATPLFNTPSPNRIQEGRGHRPACFPNPPTPTGCEQLLEGFAWRGLVWRAVGRKEGCVVEMCDRERRRMLFTCARDAGGMKQCPNQCPNERKQKSWTASHHYSEVLCLIKHLQNMQHCSLETVITSQRILI